MSKRLNDDDADGDPHFAAMGEVEARIRDVVRNDVAYLRRQESGDDGLARSVGPEVGVNSLIQRVAGTSLAEIESLIAELEAVRDILHAEGQRVQRELSGYAQLSQASMESTRMIADSVAQWKRAVDDLQNN